MMFYIEMLISLNDVHNVSIIQNLFLQCSTFLGADIRIEINGFQNTVASLQTMD